jgi:SagB-type dehydrogenase family enzyme
MSSFAAVVAVFVLSASTAALAESTDAPPAPAMRRYRDATEHSPHRGRPRIHPMDWRNRPTLYRTYEGAPVVVLPPPRRLDRQALEVIAQAVPVSDDRAARLDLSALSAILFLSGGIVDRLPNGREIRATAAAGALYPNEVYVVSGPLPGLAAGVYHYDPKRERLAQLREGDWRPALAAAAADDRVRRAPATLVLTGILWRSAWKYEERGYRHLYWDGGMKLAHVLAAAAAARLPARVLAGFVDEGVDRLLDIDGRREMSLALVPLGPGGEANLDKKENSTAETRRRGDVLLEASVSGPSQSRSPQAGLAVADDAIPPLRFTPSPLSPRPIDYPEALRYHAASALADAAAVDRFRRGSFAAQRRVTPVPLLSLPEPAPARGDGSLDAVVRRRRSTRHFTQRSITFAELAAMLSLAAAGAPADFLAARPSLIETYVIVNAVRGVHPGAYYYRRGSGKLERLKAGGFRGAAGFLCLGQNLARDASAAIFYLADLKAIGAAFGERGYRAAELEAGLVAGRAYLAAYAVGRGATGLTFYDDEVTRFFSPHAIGLEPLLVVAAGVPAKR